jgi:hypothetical protein
MNVYAGYDGLHVVRGRYRNGIVSAEDARSQRSSEFYRNTREGVAWVVGGDLVLSLLRLPFSTGRCYLFGRWPS